MLSATDNSNVTTYFLQDGLGSTTGLTDGDGAMTATYQYDVFGALKSQTGEADTNWRFTGELNDSTTARGPYYLRARYYDPALGRFLSRDPWPANPMNPQTWNGYAYVLNNPALLVDPYGLFGPGWFEKAIDVAKCALDPVGCAIDTGLEKIPGGGFAKCVLEYGPTICAGKEVAGRLVGEKAGERAANLGRQALTAAWKQMERSSDWFVNTCPGQVARTATGAAMVATGVLASEQGWGVPLAIAGVTVIFAGPPGSAPLGNCPGP